MKHPVWDRILILLCALVALAVTAGIVLLLLGKVSLSQATSLIDRIDLGNRRHQGILAAAAAVIGVIGLCLISALFPARKKRSSSFAIQRNENGMVRISLKALEALVSKCLDQHAELKVVTSSLYSDEESIRVDVHIALQSDISMPLAISALQKQIKRYIEACSGVMVQEVRVFVDSTIPATEETAKSPYAIPETLLGSMTDQLTEAPAETQPEAPAAQAAEPFKAEEVKADEPAAPAEEAPQTAEPEAQTEETKDEPIFKDDWGEA